MHFQNRIKRVVVLSLILAFTSASAQQVRPAQTGTVQSLAQDDGYITISKQAYVFDTETTRVLLQGAEVDAAILNEGLVVRFTTDNAGKLLTLEILGPADKLRELVRH